MTLEASMTEDTQRSEYAVAGGLHSRDTGADTCVCGSDACSDCLECLDDPEVHCQHCGDHTDGLGECMSGCES